MDNHRVHHHGRSLHPAPCRKRSDFRLAPVVAGAIVVTLIFGTSIIGLWTRTAAGIAAGLAPWSLSLPAAIFALVNSLVVTLRQGGVRWRDTFYSLDTLRRGNVR